MILKKLNNIKNLEYRKINNLALPLILNNVTSLIIGLCDDAMAGRISIGAFAAIGMIVSTINSITGVVGASSIAFNIIGGRCRGEKDEAGVHSNLIFNIAYSIILGLVFFAAAIFLGRFMLKNAYHFHGELLDEAQDYTSIFSLSIGLNMLLFTFSSYFKIIGKTKYIFYGSLSASILNVLFDYALIFGHFGMPKLGMKGNAVGSIVALLINLFIYIMASGIYKVKFTKTVEFARIFRNSMSIVIPLMGQEFLESTLIVVAMNYILSKIGVLQVSVYNLLATVINIALMPMYAYSQTALTIISEKTGARDKVGIKKIPMQCLFMAMLLYVILTLITIALRDYIPAVITNDKNLILSAASYIPVVVFINLMNIPNNIYKYSLQAIGKEKWVLTASIFMNAFFLIMIWIFTGVLHMALNGIYIGIFVNSSILTLVFIRKFFSLEISFKKLTKL